jgi:hypothetical protein
MEWGRLYANLASDPRCQAAQDDGGAGWLLIESMCYCTSAETGGFIPHTQVERFGGGAARKRMVAALVREKIWQPVEGGYLLDPLLWSEERNLGDQAEKKREADRKRIAARRAAARGAVPVGLVSRDSRATSRATEETIHDATCSGDSRGLEKSREEKNKTSVVSQLTVTGARGADDDDDELVAAVTDAVLVRTGCLLNGGEARAVAARVLARVKPGVAVHHPPRYVAAAIAEEADLYAELLLDAPPPLREALAAAAGDGHDYDPSPDTGLCARCRAPQVDKIHRTRRTA